jgi:hypothetical protein
MTSIQRNTILIFLAAVAARIAFHLLTGFVADDAFITFRYARNIAEGYGFVYNLGEPVLGTSTPLFTLILALFAMMRLPMIQSALIVSLVSSGLTAVILYRLALSLRFTSMSLIPPLVYILWPRSLVCDSSGMETAFFTMLITAAFYYQHKRLEFYALGMATLATAARPEGGLLLLLLLAINLYHRREFWLRYFAIPAALLGPWCAFAWYYFGSPIPNSIPAKLALYSRFGTGSILDNLVYLLAWHNLFGWVVMLAAIAGAWWLNKKQNYGKLVIVWLLAMICFFTFSRTRLFFWYVGPLYPVYLLLASAALPMLLSRVSESTTAWLKDRSATVTAVVCVVLGLILLAGSYRPVTYYRQYQKALSAMHQQIGFYLFAHSYPQALVAAEDIGYMGYYSERRILDRDGLVSPQVHSYNRRGAYRDAVLDNAPDYVVTAKSSPISGFVSDSVFLRQYEMEAEFGSGEWSYVLYSRRF